MKYFFFILIIITLLFTTSCQTFIQVFETKSTNTVIKNELFVYETDTLKITYSFWTKKGILSFSIYNKLDKPLYIDWKKSSYICNTNKLNYWVEEELVKSISYYGGYYYSGPLLKPGYAISNGINVSSSSKVKVERVTFIPPKSNYYRSQFYLLPIDYYDFDLDCDSEVVSRNDKPHKKTRIYYKEYSLDNSPLVFRNFLAFSLTENFSNELFVDNEFYLSKMNEMDYRHFKYRKKDGSGKYVYFRPYLKNTSFYLAVPVDKTVENRKKLERIGR